jgi:cytosine/adenosine deaminase-related metal-dependent hydrolase
VQKALDRGIRPALSVDVEIALSSDMFTQMRCVLLTQRMQSTQRRYRGDMDAPPFISNRDVLDFATVQGASAVGLASSVGSIAPGKQADLVVVRAEDANNLPLNNAIGTLVQGTDTRNIDSVLVAGRIAKWQGELVGQDLKKLRQQARESRDYLAARAGFSVDVTRQPAVVEIQDPFLKDYFATRQHQ